jgi:hypothetical protein
VTSLTTSNAEIARNTRRPKGFGDAGASAVLALLDDISVSPASRRLASAPVSLETRPIVLSPRAARTNPIDQHPFLERL